MEMQDTRVILHTASLGHYSACSASSGVFQVGDLGARGARSPALRHPGTPSPALSSATRAAPELLSLGQRWDSAEVPGTPEKGGAPPPRSLPRRRLRALRSGSPAPRWGPKFRGAHAGRSWLWGPGTRFSAAAPPARHTPGVGGTGLLSDLPKVAERAVTKQLTSATPGGPPLARRAQSWQDSPGCKRALRARPATACAAWRALSAAWEGGV